MIRVSLKQLTNCGGGGGVGLLLEGFCRLRFERVVGWGLTLRELGERFMVSCVEHIRIEFQ